MGGKIARSILMLGPIGRFPRAPGTAGSLAVALLIVGLAAIGLDRWAVAPLSCALFSALTLAFAGRAPAIWGVEDPRPVVSDEAAGVSLAMWTLASDPAPALSAAAAFLLFRLFDVAKPLGCRAIQRVPGAAGILLDDLLAGVYASALVHAGLVVFSRV